MKVCVSVRVCVALCCGAPSSGEQNNRLAAFWLPDLDLCLIDIYFKPIKSKSQYRGFLLVHSFGGCDSGQPIRGRMLWQTPWRPAAGAYGRHCKAVSFPANWLVLMKNARLSPSLYLFAFQHSYCFIADWINRLFQARLCPSCSAGNWQETVLQLTVVLGFFFHEQ